MHPTFEKLHQLYRKNLDGKDCAFCQRCPAHSLTGQGTAWSTQEVVEHLVLTYRSTGALFDRYLTRNSPTQNSRNMKHRALQLLVIRCGGFPRGVQAPELVRPGKTDMPAMTGNELSTWMKAELEAVDAKIEKSSQLFGKQPFASHFIFGPLTAEQWRRFHFVHGKHHLAQVKRIRKQTAAA
jgi:hypothetical protein